MLSYNKNNIFAKIIRKELSAKIIYEDNDILCFNDINPVDDIHVLVIPKNEYINYSDFISNANKDEILNFFKKIEYIAKEKLNLKEYRLITNNGEKAGQVIFHFHVHIIAKNN